MGRTGLDPLYFISIPYGAIKRIIIPKPSIKSTSFQFLMVRLKGYHKWEKQLHLQISIPYGAIKSMKLIIKRRGHTLFQFLMVRLKENLDRFS